MIDGVGSLIAIGYDAAVVVEPQVLLWNCVQLGHSNIGSKNWCTILTLNLPLCAANIHRMRAARFLSENYIFYHYRWCEREFEIGRNRSFIRFAYAPSVCGRIKDNPTVIEIDFRVRCKCLQINFRASHKKKTVVVTDSCGM